MITITNTQVDSDFNISELTSGTLDGNGVFDILLDTIEAHLQREYRAKRIRGTDYANAYIALINNALQQATGYALQRAKLALEMQLLEAQIQKVATDTIVATKQGGLFDAQSQQTMAETRQIDYVTEVRLPAEVRQTKAQTDKIIYETRDVLPKQLEQMDAQIANQKKQTDLLEFELTQIKPKELELMEKDIGLKENQIQIGLKEIALKEKQIPLMEKEIELKAQQVKITEKEVAIKEKQLEITKYELDFKLPAEVASTNAQTDLYKQKTVTEKGQTDGSVIKKDSVMHFNNQVLSEQARTYDNDSKLKLLGVLVDTWKIRYTEDPNNNEVTQINKLVDPTIGQAVDKVMNSTGIVL